MAITKLMHMKECPEWKPQHLYNAIHYILDEEKTKEIWIGGNAGVECQEVFENFMETKRFWNKEEGRQGYHFVISFSPGEVDENKCFEVAEEFCSRYLGDRYDYVFAVHNDKDHIHAHVIFNSVSRIDGLKYYYADGDWEKEIQPITDQICKEHGLSPLQFEEERIGVSYASWAAEKKGKINWSHIIRADVDLAIERAASMEEFTEIMNRLGYTLRFGYSQKREENYITFSFQKEDGTICRRRSYNLAPGYSVEEIARKIRMKNLDPVYQPGNEEVEPFHRKLEKQFSEKAGSILKQSAVLKATKTYKRLYQAVSYYKLPNPYAVPAYQVRRDMLRLDRLIEECSYLRLKNLRSVNAIEKRSQELEQQLKQTYIKRKGIREIQEIYLKSVLPDDVDRYETLLQMLEEKIEVDAAYEAAEDELKELETHLPYQFRENSKKLLECEREIEILKKEKRILDRVNSTERGEEKIITLEHTRTIRR
ncbi:MAG: relaxase/mobilization nuclease domain-containing protein [Agathobacter sp.]|nr:relaxase/mobilization nuclease domain-containing protein [Agathobacter sp.]MBP3568119.1 relaxase/mobilization nuclease domain-containing protein [Lachnospiraceae bacterium]